MFLLWAMCVLIGIVVGGGLDSIRIARRWGLVYHAFFSAGIGTALMMVPIARAILLSKRVPTDPWVLMFVLGILLATEGWIAFGVLVWQWRRGRRDAP
jgi:sterol desaturase/sphingolipid hydroxylase (fatty acid hydroxylase superfamily)